MHLKSLTLKGFKSFASPTTLRLEPGITCVVGPNGSGKSNVVDALSWVMGEQGAKALRGGKMEDVIFAGTSTRAPLGRAEVTLTIDNSDHALPIEYSEVSITRRMFRDGAGEYEINGQSCRLMDVQELLSDSGIGREMHVIVGQGRLSQILESRPEDRRAFIEEAAGVLKHRRRKEKAVRKLESMAANLARLTDLTTELRRQLKPLGRQAEVARRAATVQADLRDSRLRLAADDLVRRRDEFDGTNDAEATLRKEHSEITEKLDVATAVLAEHETALNELMPQAEQAQQTWFRLSALAERVSATVRIAGERASHLDEVVAVPTGPDPDELEAQAERVAEQERLLITQLETVAEQLAAAKDELVAKEAAVAEAQRQHLAAVSAEADRREGLARLTGQVDTMRTRLESIDSQAQRLTETIEEATVRGEVAQTEFDTIKARVAELDQGEVGLDENHERSVSALSIVNERVAELQSAERQAERQIASLKARIDALAIGLDRKDGSAWLTENHSGAGIFGSIAQLVKVRPGYQGAIATAMGPAADAVAAENAAAAQAAVAALKASDGGRAAIVFGEWPANTHARPAITLPSGAHWATDLVEAPERLATAVSAILASVVVVDEIGAAIEVVLANPLLRAVTIDGDRVGAGWVAGGSDKKQSTLEIQASIQAAREELRATESQVGEISAALAGALAEQTARQDTAEQALAALNESDAAISAVYEQLGRVGQGARIAADEVKKLTLQRDQLELGRAKTMEELAEVESRLRNAEEAPNLFDDEPVDRDDMVAELEEARSVEIEARLAVRTSEERVNSVRGKADSLRRAAMAEREARARSERAAVARKRTAAMASTVVAAGHEVAARLEHVVAAASARRDQLGATRAQHTAAIGTVREQARELTAAQSRLTDALHRDEVAKAQAVLRIEQLSEQVLEQFGMAADDLIAEYGPHVELPPTQQEMDEYEQARERGEQVSAPRPMPFDRDTQERRAKRAEKDLRELGKVNPLALEEFAALEERYNFLSTQLEDVKAARKDLLEVVADVDERILQVFTEAYADVEREFKGVFSSLFPGGEGRLVLTDPNDMLTTGIEVEARPPGKKIKRLSLLSGGEKSLTAVAMLVAIFRARPSPFYVMDEVEAALDDVNLQRLIGLFEQLREKSQLIVITHQKPTMEVADALYGVSMRDDGITQVVSQRMRGLDGQLSSQNA
ncbi:chromosome segregation protein SMC [Mycobacteroides sp. LB1]|uniref:chromosome segregation protein SMC n=1 Tax=Mycobacteroides sp. LB1 TaxID=2750814 RepID=UPI0015DE7202|nr:chromosome segregation protein SMC [Mycobacteroides sp. LB1]